MFIQKTIFANTIIATIQKIYLNTIYLSRFKKFEFISIIVKNADIISIQYNYNVYKKHINFIVKIIDYK